MNFAVQSIAGLSLALNSLVHSFRQKADRQEGRWTGRQVGR